MGSPHGAIRPGPRAGLVAGDGGLVGPRGLPVPLKPPASRPADPDGRNPSGHPDRRGVECRWRTSRVPRGGAPMKRKPFAVLMASWLVLARVAAGDGRADRGRDDA